MRPARANAIQIPRRMSPQVASRFLRSNQTKTVRTKTTATMVAGALIRNITAAHPIAPSMERDQWTENFGRNEGLWRNFSIPAAMFRTP